MTYVAVATLLFLGSCVAENFPADGPVDMPANGSQVHKPNSFVAFRIYLDDTSSTRTAFDSDFSDTNGFNKGLEFERALYFPDTPTDDKGDSEDDDQVDESEENTGTTPPDERDGSEENKPNQSYHFAILFNTDGTLQINEIIPLELIRDEKDTDYYYTVYAKFYDPEKEENPFGNKFQGTVLVVLNASYDLEESIKKKIKTPEATYNNIRILPLQNAANNTDPDNFLYLKDKDGGYIKDKDGNKYFTMSSSMIIKNREVVPAIDGGKKEDTGEVIPAFTIYSDMDEAKENPTSLYVERLTAKFTVVFKNRSSYYYIKPVSTNNNATTENYAGNSETGGKENPYGVERLIIDQSATNNYIRVVPEYDRSPSITQRNEPIIYKSNQWKVNITGWDINALESKENLFKNLEAGKDYSPSSGEDNSWFFNSDYPYRTLWAEDLNYDTGNYPVQRRKVIKNFYLLKHNDTGEIEEKEEIDNVKAHETMKSPSLSYLNFEQLSNRKTRVYVPENTFSRQLMIDQITTRPLDKGSYAYDQRLYLKTGSHLIVTAQLLINGISSSYSYACNVFDENGLSLDSSGDPSASIYYMNDIYWTEKAYKEYVAEYLAYFMQTDKNQSEEDLKKTFGRNDGIFYVWDESAKEMVPAHGTDFKFDTAYVKGGDNYVLLLPDDKPIYTLNLDEKEAAENPSESGEEDTNNDSEEDPGMKSDTNFEVPSYYHEISLNNYKNLFYAHPELMAACYTAGMMYYVEGSKHNLDSSNFKTNNLPNVSTGDYGTVRNNWYSFSVDAITKPGVAVHTPEQPIVPNVSDKRAIATSIQVLPWHEIPTSVDTGEQNRPGRDKN